jgi:hypothetical protein
MPAVLPVTTPAVLTVARVLAVLQVPDPPDVARVIVAPSHTDDVPEIVPAFGSGFIVILRLAVALPHELDTV